MKKWLLLLLLALAGVAGYYFYTTRSKGPASPPSTHMPVAVSKYGESYTAAMEETLQQYYHLSEAFVNWDSSIVVSSADSLLQRLNALPMDAVRKDSLIYQTAMVNLDAARTDLQKLTDGASNLEQHRRIFHSFSQNLYDLLRTLQYDGSKVYLQECPMAFNETEPGTWLSAQKQIRNPYLGLKHPKYKAGMLICGETKDSLAYRPENKL